jgi:hypothetical protein
VLGGVITISTELYSATLIGAGVTLRVGLTPDVEGTSLLWNLKFDENWRKFPTDFQSWLYGTVTLESLEAILNLTPDSEFCFISGCAEMKIYIGKWGIRTGFIVELLYNPSEYGRWPNRKDLAKFLLDRGSPILNHQLAFICEHENLQKFYKELSSALIKMGIKE